MAANVSYNILNIPNLFNLTFLAKYGVSTLTKAALTAAMKLWWLLNLTLPEPGQE